MPNWVSVNVKFDTTKSAASEIINSLKNKDGDIDFNVLIPRPECLSLTQSPCSIISHEDYNSLLSLHPNGTQFMAGSGITKEMQAEYIALYGADNWYDWSVKHWGTKWNVNEVQIDEDTIHFRTAWSMPFPYIETISAKFPTVKILCSWADEDIGSNLGYVELLGGDVIFSEEPDGSDDFINGAAYQIQGGAIHWDDKTCEETAKEFNWDDDNDDNTQA